MRFQQISLTLKSMPGLLLAVIRIGIAILKLLWVYVRIKKIYKYIVIRKQAFQSKKNEIYM